MATRARSFSPWGGSLGSLRAPGAWSPTLRAGSSASVAVSRAVTCYVARPGGLEVDFLSLRSSKRCQLKAGSWSSQKMKIPLSLVA